MKSFLAITCLLALSVAKTTADGHCAGYTDLAERSAQAAVDCKDLADAVVPGEQGCELREEVAGVYAYSVCVLSQEYIGWAEEDGKFLFEKIESELETIQVEDELDGILENCREEARAISRDELERVAADILHPGVEVGEQEECWDTFQAETEVRRLYLAVCLSEDIADNAPAECLPAQAPFSLH